MAGKKGESRRYTVFQISLSYCCQISLGTTGMPESAIYSSTKFAIRGMTQSAGGQACLNDECLGIERQYLILAFDYGKYGITVNAYAPGVIETGLRMFISLTSSRSW